MAATETREDASFRAIRTQFAERCRTSTRIRSLCCMKQTLDPLDRIVALLIADSLIRCPLSCSCRDKFLLRRSTVSGILFRKLWQEGHRFFNTYRQGQRVMRNRLRDIAQQFYAGCLPAFLGRNRMQANMSAARMPEAL